MAGSNVQFSFSLSLFNRIRAWYRVDFAQSGGQLDGRKDRGFFKVSPNDCEAWKEFAREKLFADSWYVTDRPMSRSFCQPMTKRFSSSNRVTRPANFHLNAWIFSFVEILRVYFSRQSLFVPFRNSLVISPQNSIMSFVSNSYSRLKLLQNRKASYKTLFARTRRVYVFARSTGVHRARRGRISRR